MRNLVTGQQMKAIDAYTINEIGIPSLVLQERAGWCIAQEVEKRISRGTTIWAVCGTGNNGADAAAAARMLHLAGYKSALILAGDREKETGECRLQREICEKLGISGVFWQDVKEELDGVIIDGLFGVGLARPVEGEFRQCMDLISRQPAKLKVAVDIPSGIHSDSGAVMGSAFRADVTVTFGWEKCGTVLFPGREYAGEVVIGDIGFPELAYEKVMLRSRQDLNPAFTYGPEDLSLLPCRPEHSNKGTFGHVLIAAGSRTMSGAAYLSAKAAYRCGAGLVKILTVEENRQILQQLLPEAILAVYDPEMAWEDPEGFGKLLEDQCVWADAVVLGPGLGTEPYVKELVAGVLSAACSTVVIDADGLNVIAANPELTRYYTENIVITPHLGEMARLTGKTIREIQEDVSGTAAEYASFWGIHCVLKDAATAAADRDGRLYLNTSGNSAMAKAGSGDVLAGIIGALCAQGMEPFEGAILSVYLHGLAGDRYWKEKGKASLLASELADMAGELADMESKIE
ncbi:MAG: NAD(P)H-hydrate dehydratase [Lachnospiraceae bacterium]|jgi:hydroxyethylthiazole kinase-like uncharacterized protein yjeF